MGAGKGSQEGGRKEDGGGGRLLGGGEKGAEAEVEGPLRWK